MSSTKSKNCISFNNRIIDFLHRYIILFLAVFLLAGYFSIASRGFIEYRYNQSDKPEHIRNTVIELPLTHSDGLGYYAYLPHYLMNDEIA